MSKFDKYGKSKKNPKLIRYKFLTPKQTKGQKFDDLVMQFKKTGRTVRI